MNTSINDYDAENSNCGWKARHQTSCAGIARYSGSSAGNFGDGHPIIRSKLSAPSRWQVTVQVYVCSSYLYTSVLVTGRSPKRGIDRLKNANRGCIPGERTAWPGPNPFLRELTPSKEVAKAFAADSGLCSAEFGRRRHPGCRDP